jgi:glycerol uptake facilitator-like aquaporin
MNFAPEVTDVQDRGPAAYIAEFVGTFLLVFFVTAVVSLYVSPDPARFTDFSVIGLVHAFVLFGLIQTLGLISGAHFNPAVTFADASQRGLPWGDVPGYIAIQVVGAFAGVATAHLMFELPLFFASRHVRSGPAQAFSEFVATFGLLSVIWGCARLRSAAVPFAVAAYITAAYWFSASTSFANPAVTLARSATDTFAGIRPADAPAFIVAQLLGAACATALFRWLVPTLPDVAPTVVVPHSDLRPSDSPHVS